MPIIRKEMSDQDTDANHKAIDSLMNFETVKYSTRSREAAIHRAMEVTRPPRSRDLLFRDLLEFRPVLLHYSGLRDRQWSVAGGVPKRRSDGGLFVMVNDYMIQAHHAAQISSARSTARIRQLSWPWARCMTFSNSPEVTNKPGGRNSRCRGEVLFDDIFFSYDAARPI